MARKSIKDEFFDVAEQTEIYIWQLIVVEWEIPLAFQLPACGVKDRELVMLTSFLYQCCIL